MTYALILVGLLLLFLGGEFLVRGSVSVARRLGLSELLIGLTLVGFGTSTPELVTSLQAIGQGSVGVAVGNVVGSNIANILLILGLAAVLSPIVTRPRELSRDLMVMVAATVTVAALCWFDQFNRVTGVIMVAILILYVVMSVILDRKGGPPAELHAAEAQAVTTPDSLLIGIVLAITGLVGVVFGADLLVKNAVIVAREFGLSEAVIGLTLVAVGTSLPELATSVVAALRGKSDVAVGNIIGSNIFNVFGILGVVTLVKPFSVVSVGGGELSGGAEPQWSEVLSSGAGGSILTFGDVGMLGLSAAMLVLFAYTGKRIARWEGVVLLLAYAAYMAFLFGAAR